MKEYNVELRLQDRVLDTLEVSAHDMRSALEIAKETYKNDLLVCTQEKEFEFLGELEPKACDLIHNLDVARTHLYNKLYKECEEMKSQLDKAFETYKKIYNTYKPLLRNITWFSLNYSKENRNAHINIFRDGNIRFDYLFMNPNNLHKLEKNELLTENSEYLLNMIKQEKREMQFYLDSIDFQSVVDYFESFKKPYIDKLVQFVEELGE